MNFLKQGPRRWAAPVALAAVLVAGLMISPAIGGPKFVTGQKVVKTIQKKTQGRSIQVTGSKDLAAGGFDFNNPGTLVASLSLAQGSYMISSTATVTRTSGLTVQCRLTAGSKVDKTSLFSTGAGTTTEDMALGVAAFVPAGGTAQLRCADGSAGSDGKIDNAEIQTLKVPKLKIQTVAAS
ncbi:MAG: hypothetical protein FJW90_03770 [Actinobacteria bacterium]|nr:hypothetical protein [Actinomycetota bacterium]